MIKHNLFKIPTLGKFLKFEILIFNNVSRPRNHCAANTAVIFGPTLLKVDTEATVTWASKALHTLLLTKDEFVHQ